ncbi:MAG: DUF2807 domain-containing protein [Muribaculaceae bacterium]|nr:DUF2807 domain-containing protein [Muribaculaceae bacterium]
MTNLILSVAIAAMFVACSPGALVKACSDGNVSISNGKDSDATVKKTVKISDFDEIDASQGIKVVFTQGANSGTAKISTTPSAADYLTVEVQGSTLHAYYKGTKKASIKGPSIIYVSSPVLREADLSSAARLEVKGDLNVDGSLDIDISSASSVIFGNVVCSELNIDASSAASLECGSVKGGNLDIDISSAGKVSCTSFKGDSLKINSSSASKTVVDGIDCGDVYVEASSTAAITLAGNASRISKNVSSGASLNSSKLVIR